MTSERMVSVSPSGNSGTSEKDRTGLQKPPYCCVFRPMFLSPHAERNVFSIPEPLSPSLRVVLCVFLVSASDHVSRPYEDVGVSCRSCGGSRSSDTNLSGLNRLFPPRAPQKTIKSSGKLEVQPELFYEYLGFSHRQGGVRFFDATVKLLIHGHQI